MINDIEAMLKPVVEGLGYELWGCEYLMQNRRALLRLYIDQPAGISLDDCTRVSHQVSAYLNVEDRIPGDYTLEISSPGIPRPLFRKEQYSRYYGQRIQLNLKNPINDKRKLAGTLIAANDKSILLTVNETELEILFSEIRAAHLI
ncbi:MAG: ribosome maturation factor RimP [Legionella sp.]|nr:ribosome maturation factor RimP [Legionella sp.]